jgi:protein-disulfide isomerase
MITRSHWRIGVSMLFFMSATAVAGPSPVMSSQAMPVTRDEVDELRREIARLRSDLDRLKATRPTGVPRPSLNPEDLPPIPIVGGASKGNAAARLVLIEYADFECPFCRRYASDTFPLIEHEYVATGRIRYVFRHLPLRKHSLALRAALTADCAGVQGQFWPMHNWLFSHPIASLTTLPESDVTRINIDYDALKRCVIDSKEDPILEEARRAEALGITGTPTFVAGTLSADGSVKVREVIVGARPFEYMTAILDRLLKDVPNTNSR